MGRIELPDKFRDEDSAPTPTDDLGDRPYHSFRQAELHEVRERMHEESLDWVPNVTTRDIRDLRSAQLLGENLLRMKRSGRHEDDVADYTLERQRRSEEIDGWAS